MENELIVEDRRIVWVDNTETMAKFILAAEKETELSVDLEADSLHHYRDRVCLLQVSTSKTDWIIDPQKQHILPSLWKLLEDPAIVKIFHDADFDLRSLDRDYGLRVKNVFDTKVSAELLGWKKLGLSALLTEYFNVKLSKRFQRYAWGRRPIRREALVYAAMDTRYLHSLKKICEAELRAKSRRVWADEEFAYLESFRWSPSKRDRLKFWKLGGVKKLKPQFQELLKRFWEIREIEAERRDTPPFKVFGDEDMLEIVRTSSWQDSFDLIDANKKFSIRIAKEMKQALKIAQKMPENKCPQVPEELRFVEVSFSKSLLDRLKETRNRNAYDHKIDPGIISGMKTMKLIASFSDEQLLDFSLINRETGLRHWQWCFLGLSVQRD